MSAFSKADFFVLKKNNWRYENENSFTQQDDGSVQSLRNRFRLDRRLRCFGAKLRYGENRDRLRGTDKHRIVP
jgi:hypothetical protein